MYKTTVKAFAEVDSFSAERQFEENVKKFIEGKSKEYILGAQIKIYTYGRNSRSTYSTVIHELAHASHWNMWRKADDFDDTESIVKESWARGVEWELTRMVYSSYSP